MKASQYNISCVQISDGGAPISEGSASLDIDEGVPIILLVSWLVMEVSWLVIIDIYLVKYNLISEMDVPITEVSSSIREMSTF